MTDERAADRSLGLEIGKGFVGKLLQAVLGFAGTVLFARILGPTDFGGYYLLLSLIGIARRPIDGVSGATRKRFAESDAPRREIFGAQVLTNGLLIAVMGGVAMLAAGQLRSYTGLDDAGFLFVVLFGALVMFTPFQGFLVSIGRVGTQTWIDTLRSVVTFGLQLALVLSGLAAAGMVFGLAGATLLMLPLTHWYLRTVPALPSVEILRSIWSFAKYSIPATFVGKAYDRFDVLLLGFIASPAAAGQYEVAYKLTVPATFIASVAGSGLMARVSDLVSRGESVAEDIENSLAFTSSIAIPLFFGALAIPDAVVVTAYGPDYRAAALLLVGLGLYRVFHTQSTILVGLLSGLDRPDVEMNVSVVALAVNVVLGVSLYFVYGPFGVVLATVVAEALRYGAFHLFVRRETSARLVPRALLEQVAAGAVMFVAVEFVSRSVSVTSWRQLLVLVGFGAAVYFLVLTAISHHFRVTVRAVLEQARAEYLDRDETA